MLHEQLEVVGLGWRTNWQMATSPQKGVVLLRRLLPNHLGPADQVASSQHLVGPCISEPQVSPMPVGSWRPILEAVQLEPAECWRHVAGQRPAVLQQCSLLRRLRQALVLLLGHILLQVWGELECWYHLE